MANPHDYDARANIMWGGDGSGSGKIGGFTTLEQSDVEAIYRLML